SATALAKWSSRLQREARAKRRQALVPVHVVGELAPASAMVVQHGVWRLTVPVGTDPRWLATLLRELIAC
ncbi:hypothetical protein, partial [Tahibacter caeni]|uniref:hypothetical protein n=1 Tax=Tahibacter caeni TaxID=1453545 RepID=UPI0021498521